MAEKVLKNSLAYTADMRIGWLLWKKNLEEFLYFEEEIKKPEVDILYASWNETPARGARKSFRSLRIYNKITEKKVYSVTTVAGAKIQPYFDIPLPDDPNLYHFKVQGVSIGNGLVKVWLTKTTASYLEALLGGLDKESISNAIKKINSGYVKFKQINDSKIDVYSIAVPVIMKYDDYQSLKNKSEYISDEYMFQQLATEFSQII